MSFSYNYNRISASGTFPVDFVRFKLDDTDSAAYDLEDEVITVLFNDTYTGDTQTVRNYQTAVKAAMYLWTKYSKQVTFSSAGTSMNLSDLRDHWWNVVQTLQAELNLQRGIAPVLYPYRQSSFSKW